MEATELKENFGKMVKDKDSGFVGKITGVAEYTNKNPSFLVTRQLKEDEDKEYRSMWLDTERVEFID